MSSRRKGDLSAVAKAEILSPEMFLVARGQALHLVEASNGMRANNGECIYGVPEPASQIRYHVRTGVERADSEVKDNYGANHVRIKDHLKVLCHLMFGVLVLTVKQIFNFFA